MARCSAIKRNGERCKVEAMPDSQLCWSHDPSFQQERTRRASKAGKAGGRGRPQAEINEIKDKLHQLAADVLAGEVVRGDAAVVSQIYNTILAAVRTELKRREQEELVGRLEALEDGLAARKRGSGYGA